jgi:predicted outer membrane repeat protein
MFVNGNAVNGGAVAVSSGGYLGVTNCTFENNTATTYGGALYVEQGSTLIVLNSTFLKNHASTGSAVFAQVRELFVGFLKKILNSIIFLWMFCILVFWCLQHNASILFEEVTLLTPTLTAGAVVHAIGAKVELLGTQFICASRPASSPIVVGLTGTLIGSETSKSTGCETWISASGNDIFGLGTPDAPLKTLNAAVVSLLPGQQLILEGENYVPNFGGVVIQGAISILISGTNNSKLIGNSADGILSVQNSQNVTLQGISFVSGHANTSLSTASNEFLSGGLTIVSSTVSLNSVIIANCTSGLYGGGLASIDSVLKISNSNFSNCGSSVSGGAISMSSSNVTIRSVVIQSSSASVNGGAIFASNHSNLVSSKLQISTCAAVGNGGGVFVQNSLWTGSQTTASNNSANNGGSVGMFNSIVTSTDSAFTSNFAALLGGSISIEGSGTYYSSRDIFLQNRANAGAAISLTDSSDAFFSDSTLTSNTAVTAGGAFYVDGSSLSIYGSSFGGNCRITSNGAKEG